MERSDLMTWRKARYLNQLQLGRLLNVSRQTIINWEQGHTPVPDDLHVRLMEIGPKTDAEQAQQATRITAAAFPHLFEYQRDIACHLPSRLHPNSLARRGLLGWHHAGHTCIWPWANTMACRPAHPDILETEAYALALADLEAGRTHPGVEGVKTWFRTGFAPDGIELVVKSPWPDLMLTEAIMPLRGFHWDGDPAYLFDASTFPDGARMTVYAPLPDGYGWKKGEMWRREEW